MVRGLMAMKGCKVAELTKSEKAAVALQAAATAFAGLDDNNDGPTSVVIGGPSRCGLADHFLGWLEKNS